MSDEEAKSASAQIASEAIKVIPDADKQMAGRGFGGALANLGAVAEDVTFWLRLAAGAPRNAIGFFGRVAEGWRRLPVERRARPAPKLLLEAAAGYSTTIDEELKIRYERLLASAIDVETAPRVHPSFPTIIGEMTGVEARVLDHFLTGEYFDSFNGLLSALGFPLSEHHQFAVCMGNLVRLGLIESFPAPVVTPKSANTPALRRELAQLSKNAIQLEVVRDVDSGDGLSTAYVSESMKYILTALGHDFLTVTGRH